MKKRLLKYMLACSLMVVGGTSCQDRLDYNEVTEYDSQEVFSSFNRTRSFVSNVYSRLQNGMNDGFKRGAVLASACDEAEFAWTDSNIHHFFNGAWNKNNTLTTTWADMYSGIRAVNFYLRESQGQTFDSFKHNEEYLQEMERFERYQYEVRFLRAFFYFNLVRTYGDVPLITTVLTEDEANSLGRTSADEVFQFIFDECDDIADKLPVDYAEVSFAETGRVTKLAVYALKARAAMYAASPLFSEPDNSKWEYAAAANKKVLDECAKNGVVLQQYQALWGDQNYKGAEVIMERRLGELNEFEKNNFPVGVEGGNSGNCPSQTLVDAYRMKKTGKLWNEPNSGYNAENPYEGRDPRFELTIAHNGTVKWPAYNTTPLQVYDGGINGFPTPGASTTGYYLKKYCDNSVNLKPNYVNKKRHSWIIFRLGEFYLNYAESVFNYLGSADAKDATYTLSAVDALNVIRQRPGVGMPKIQTGLSNDEFINYYENERMVELAFEQHRFWDVRRWKKGEEFKTIKLMKVTFDSNSGKCTYTPVVKQREWDDKMYFFPIADVELRKNSNLKQNPGWENTQKK